jgi:hypothetical protein
MYKDENMAIKISFKPREVTKKILKTLPDRSVDILKRRYGLGKSVKKETLESVGRIYGITRERVRQIESSAILTLRKSEVYDGVQPIFKEIAGIIHDLGSVIPEYILLKELSSNELTQNHIHFLLVVGGDFSYMKEDRDFVHRWHVDKEVAKKIQTVLNKLQKKIKKDQLLAEHEIIEMLNSELGNGDNALKKSVKNNSNVITNWLKLTKHLGSNKLGDWGRSDSPGVHMRGVREMAWLVLRKHGSPMHYTEVANEIKNTFKQDVHKATTHNELIKDPRFVLVGRGLYALAEWGYTSGLVKDVISDILKENGPLLRKDLIEMVKRERYVKTNTIMVNLQDTKLFGVDKDKKYFLK